MKLPIAVAAALTASLALAGGDPPTSTPESGTTIRVGGDTEVLASWDARKKKWRSGASDIDTALPEGYPPPTPPGAIEIKTYPSVRRAEIAADGERGFRPLFRHIQRNDIAMTAPVEMDYQTSGTAALRTASMSFLYRTPELHETGTDPGDARITIRDAEPVTVLSLGGRGSYELRRVQRDVATLRDWLSRSGDWEEAGEPRALMYNGPSFTPWNKWLEVQVPVRRREAAGNGRTP